MKHTPSSLATGYLCLGLAGLTSLPAFAKYTPFPILLTCAYLAALAIGAAWLLTKEAVVLRRTALVLPGCVALCLVLAAANHALYPRTRAAVARSSAPEAMIEPATRMYGGRPPYDGRLSDGAPISPGPGWIAAHAPLTLSGLIWLMAPLHLLVASAMLAYFNGAAPLFFMAFVLALPAYVQMSVVGHDIFAVGCAMLTVTLGTFRSAGAPVRHVVLWSLAAGLVATARAPLLVSIPILGVLLATKCWKRGLVFMACAGGLALALHVGAWQWSQSPILAYQPFHVFSRAERAGQYVMPVGLALSAGLAAWLWRRGVQSVSDWLRFMWAVAGLPFVVVGIGELASPAALDWSTWEGKVYVGFTLPLLIAAFVLDAVTSGPALVTPGALDESRRR